MIKMTARCCAANTSQPMMPQRDRRAVKSALARFSRVSMLFCRLNSVSCVARVGSSIWIGGGCDMAARGVFTYFSDIIIDFKSDSGGLSGCSFGSGMESRASRRNYVRFLAY